MGEPKRLLRQRQQQQQLQQLQQQPKEPSPPSPPSPPPPQSSQRRAQNSSAQTTIHDNIPVEGDGDDKDGEQGGQFWRKPTKRPTPFPTTLQPTQAPTSHPTLHGQVHILRGVMWYDRNGNGVRDSNVVARGMGHDVEYSHGVGGVVVQLLECDVNTGRAYKAEMGEAIEKTATFITQGGDHRNRPQVVQTNDQNGKFNIRLPGLERYYYVHVKAPVGYFITAGICNDDHEGWECDYTNSITKPESPDESSEAPARKPKPKGSDGISTGRSNACVFVDKMGKVEGPINFGIMREGDSQIVGTTVLVVMEFDTAGIHSKGKNKVERERALAGMLRRATKIEDEVDGGGVTTKTRYLLGERDRDAIGTVTAEVLASVSLDRRLAESGVTLDSVEPQEVIVSEEQAEGTELAVELEIKGHYSPPPELDFDYIVQSSINADTQQIRRGLRDYNSKCRDQTSKVNAEGLVEEDFGGTTSTSGTNIINSSSRDNIFSTACSSNHLVPEYFETSLQAIEAKKVEDVVFFKPKEITYYEEEYDPLFELWAVGPVAAIAGLIVLLVGFLLFRRALRLRRVDKYVDNRTTNDVDGDEKRRFGEEGGADDDGSVDSAFYSDSEEEETEKERKKRRKRKEKSNEKGKVKFSKEERKALRKSRRELMVEIDDEELPNLVSGKASRGRKHGQLGMSNESLHTVDSSFYSDHGSDLEETDKERKARRKKNQKQKEELLKQLTKTKSSKTLKEGSSTRNLSQIVRNTSRRSSSARNLSRSASSAAPNTSRRRSSSVRNLSRSASSAAPNPSRSRSSSVRNLSSSTSSAAPSMSRRMSPSVRNLSSSTSSAAPSMSRRLSSSTGNLSRSTSAVKLSSTKKSSSNLLSTGDFAMDPSSTPSTRRRKKEAKLSISMGGEDMNNSSSFSSSDGTEKNPSRKGKRGAAKSSLKRSSSSSSSIRNPAAPSLDRQPSRRGRTKQSGGDNAKSFTDAQIV